MNDIIRARIYIFDSIQSERAIDRAYLTELTGKRDGDLHRFITSVQAELPPSRASKSSKSGRTVNDGFMALAAAIYEPPGEEE